MIMHQYILVVCSVECFIRVFSVFFFFFNDTATTEIYTLSLHDALPILADADRGEHHVKRKRHRHLPRSEEHTSELQSRGHLVCRLLLEKKKNTQQTVRFQTDLTSIKLIKASAVYD